MSAKHGRKLDDAAVGLLVGLLRAKDYAQVIAALKNVNPLDFAKHLRAGRKNARSADGQLCIAITMAECEAEGMDSREVYHVGSSDPRELVVFLDTRFPERWGPMRAEVKKLGQRIESLEKLLRERFNKGGQSGAA